MMNQTGEIMACPKCKAKIGVISEQIATNSGLSSGRICYICGYWIQEYPNRN